MLIKMDDSKSYMCPQKYCLYLEASQHQLLTHTKNSHPDKSLYVCLHCNRSFCRLKKMIRHVEKNHSDSEDNQGEMFSVYVPDHYLNEQKFQNWNTKFKVYCSLCDFKTNDAGKFNRHFLVHNVHSLGENETSVNDQSIENGSDVEGPDVENTLKSSVTTSQSKSEEVFNVSEVKDEPCADSNSTDDCNGMQDSDLKDHKFDIRGFNFEMPQATKCPLKKRKTHRSKTCTECGKYVQNIYDHMPVHYPPRFECTLCNYKASWKRDLKAHMLVHFPKRAFECNICAKSFKSCSDLYKHAVVHTEEKKFSCDNCGKCFKLKHQLERHTLLHMRP